VEVDKIYAYTTLAAELPILRRGATGNAVKLVQLIVGAEPDGSWGPKTDEAVEKWQKAHKQEADLLFDKPDWQIALDWLATI
jgi:peptidoglycan hydrolase-like protein with peptidoglycan-binding domain